MFAHPRSLAAALALALMLPVAAKAAPPGDPAPPPLLVGAVPAMQFPIAKLGKWQAVAERHRPDRARLAACVGAFRAARAVAGLLGLEPPAPPAQKPRKGAAASPCAEPWIAEAVAASAAPEDALARLNRFVNRARYVGERGDADVWKAPRDLFGKGGDCEDYAIAKYLMLEAAGVPAENMRILLLAATRRAVAHAVLVVETASGPRVLDNMQAAPYRPDRALSARIVYAFNADAMWLAMHNRVVAAAP